MRTVEWSFPNNLLPFVSFMRENDEEVDVWSSPCCSFWLLLLYTNSVRSTGKKGRVIVTWKLSWSSRSSSCYKFLMIKCRDLRMRRTCTWESIFLSAAEEVVKGFSLFPERQTWTGMRNGQVEQRIWFNSAAAGSVRWVVELLPVIRLQLKEIFLGLALVDSCCWLGTDMIWAQVESSRLM